MTPTPLTLTTAIQMLLLMAATSFEHRGPSCLLTLARSTTKHPPGVYLWHIPPVSLYLAVSNHAAAAATLSLTLSAGPLGACSRIPHIQPPRPSPLSPPLALQSQSPHLRPTLPRVHPLPQQPSVFPGAVLRSVTKPPLGREKGVSEGPPQAPPEAKAPRRRKF